MTPKDFIEQFELDDHTIVEGCFASLFISEKTIAFKFKNNADWNLLFGDSIDVENAETIEPEILVPLFEDQEVTLETASVPIHFYPHIDGLELSIAVATDPVSLIHADDFFREMIAQTQQIQEQ